MRWLLAFFLTSTLFLACGDDDGSGTDGGGDTNCTGSPFPCEETR
ncbi:MAG: hypothetical protein AAGE52_08100 [Myxococcota bacterium]